MTPVRLLKNLSDLNAYSFWKVCHPLRLLKTVRSLETLKYSVVMLLFHSFKLIIQYIEFSVAL